jgi:hypothetical protein
MYDIAIALKRFRPLIKWVARHNANPYYYKMAREDLEAEGLLTLVQCCQQFPKGEIRFARFFKKSLYNRIKKLVRYSRCIKRQGVEVDLDSIEHLAKPSRDTEFIEQIQKRVGEILPYLSPESARFLRALVNPNDEATSHEAWKELCRRNKLRTLGIRTSNVRKFRVEERHFKRALRMNTNDVNEAIREIQSVYQHLTLRRKSNG